MGFLILGVRMAFRVVWDMIKAFRELNTRKATIWLSTRDSAGQEWNYTLRV
eukprot:m.182843 g.182843  ORF g.182843 m.182843 type:complete len:51 (+) comp14675_c2_seq3:1931-2083(+)